MGKKLLEQNGAEMATTLVTIAGPVKNFIDDEEFSAAWQKCTAKGMRLKMTDVLRIYAEMAPFIFGDKHIQDTLAILAAIEGTTVKAMLRMNGAALIGDALRAWKEQIQPFFMGLGITA